MFYLITKLLLITGVLFVNRSYRELIHYSEITTSNTAGNFHNLSSQISNAVYLNGALIGEGNPLKISRLLFTDSQTIIQQLQFLKSNVQDVVTMQIVSKLDSNINAVLPWILRSNVPDSIINHASPNHLASLQRIDALINEGIQRTDFLLAVRKKKLDGVINSEGTAMIFFIVVAGILFFYTTYKLFSRTSKGKVQERELEIANRRLRNAQRLVHIGNWEYNIDADELYWSDEAYRIFGIEKAGNYQLHFKDFEKRIHPEEVNILMRFKSIPQEAGAALNFNHRIISHDGQEKMVQEIAEIEFNKETNTYWLIGTIRDVTTEIQNLVALKKSKKSLNKIMDSSLDIICTIDEAGKFLKVSAASAKIWGYTPNELIGKPYMNFVYSGDSQKTTEGASMVISGEDTTNFENSYVHKDGSLVPMLWSARWDDREKMMYCIARDATEKIKKEVLMIASEKKYKNLFESNPSPMLVWDVETMKIIDCNEETLIKYGYTRNEFLRLTIRDIRPAEDIPILEQIIKTDQDYFRDSNRVFRHKKKSGELMFMNITAHLIEHDGKGAWLVLLGDITQKLKAEEQREFEKRDKAALINSTDDLIWSVSSEFKLIAANAAFIQHLKVIIGFAIKAGDDLMMRDVFPDDFLAFWREVYSKALSGEFFRKEVYLPPFNNSKESWAEISFNPVYESDTVVGIACYSRNITERKKAMKQLQIVHERLFFHLENSPVAFIEWDNHVKPKTWSKRAEEIFGWTEKEATFEQIDWFSKVYEADRPFANAMANEMITGRVQKNHVQQRNYTKDGRIIWCEWFNSVLKDDDGNVISFLSLIQDITERKQNEENLLVTNEELRNLSTHLQNIREEERLRIAREIHDELGQQLTGIKLNVSWLNKKLISDDKDIRSKISNSIKLIDVSINSVRKIASDLRPSILDDLGLSEAIEWQGLQFTKDTGVPVEFLCNIAYEKFTPDISNNIFRIFQESLTNIARHANASIVTCTLQKTGRRLILQVSDNGTGFNKDQPVNKKALGLLGIRERVEMLKGNCDIVSTIGRGTIVSVEIPLTEDQKKSLLYDENSDCG